MADSKRAASPSDAEASGLRALDRLRDRVEKAAREIERLRAENRDLAARVAEIDAGESGLSLDLGGDPAAMRAQVEGFIEAVDRLLAEPADDAAESS